MTASLFHRLIIEGHPVLNTGDGGARKAGHHHPELGTGEDQAPQRNPAKYAESLAESVGEPDPPAPLEPKRWRRAGAWARRIRLGKLVDFQKLLLVASCS